MTVLDYLTSTLGLSPDRADSHLRSSFVRVFRDHEEVETVRDGSRELAPGESVVLQPPAVTEEVARNV